MMNCAHCNAPLLIEDETCPYCGAANPHFTTERAQMKDMSEEFEETQQEVVETAKRTTRATAQITIVCALIALNLLVMLLTANQWRLYSTYKYWRTNKNAEEIRITLEEYSDAQDPVGMYNYYEAMVYGYDNDLSDYRTVRWAIANYSSIQENVFKLVFADEDEYADPARFASSISNYLEEFYTQTTQDEYDDPEQFNETHQATIDMTQKQLEALLSTYLGISPEEIPALLELSDARRAVVIEEGALANAK